MPFEIAFEPEEMTVLSDRLVLTVIAESDAAEAVELLSDSRLTFLHEGAVPPTVADYAGFAREAREGVHNRPDRMLIHWAVRLRESGVLVGLLTADLTEEMILRPDAGPIPVRVGEATVYLHPDAQGHSYGPESVAAMYGLVADRFVLNRRKLMIRWDNERAHRLAERGGFAKLGIGMTQNGYETWIRDN